MTAVIPSSILTPETLAMLKDYQRQKLEQEAADFIELNNESGKFHWHKCPKCGAIEPSVSPRGFTKKGKRILKCNECGKSTVIDAGQLTYYSHQDQAKWDQTIEDLFDGVSLRETAKKLHIHVSTAWHMRHKLLHALQILTEQTVLEGEIEMDGKYIPESSKGSKHMVRAARHRGEKASKRGLSECQVCLATGVQRGGNAFLTPVSLATPTSDDLMAISSLFKNNSFVWTDGKTTYRKLLELKDCDWRIVGNCKTYTSVDHLNNVNSFHSSIEKWIAHWRNIATKYAARYCAFMTLAREYAGCTPQEIKLKLIKRLRNISDYFYIYQINDWINIFMY